MKKLLSLLAAATLVVSCAAAESVVIGGTDGPTGIYCLAEGIEYYAEPSQGSITLSFDANITTGYEWTAEILSGDAVEIDEAGDGYVSDPNPDMLVGVGGTHYFKLNALKSGMSLVRFVWTRGGDEVADEVLLQIVVTDDLMIYAIDATENGIDSGMIDPSEEASELTVPLDMPELAVEGGILIGAYYHCSGDENGNIFSAGIDWTEDGTLVLTVEEKDCHSDPLTVSRYAADFDSLARIATIINENNMVTWSEREDVISVCDAAYPQLCLVIAKDDGSIVNTAISGYIDLTDEEAAAWKAVKEIILEGRTGELIETYQIEDE